MTTLCIDTATEHGTVVVVRDDGSLASLSWRSASRHGENLFGYIEAVMAEAEVSRDELRRIGVDIGPGRFTSLRVGLGTAKGLALGLDLPIVGVSSLRILARSIDCETNALRVPVMNAYRGDVFSAAYLIGDSGIEELAAPLFGSPEVVFAKIRQLAAGRRVALGGEGVQPHAAAIEAALDVKLDEAQLSHVAARADAVVAEVEHAFEHVGPSDLDSLEPQYLRPSDAKLPEQALRSDR